MWDSWDVEWRDIVVLDAQNRRLAVYPVLDKSLDDPANRAELRLMLENALQR